MATINQNTPPLASIDTRQIEETEEQSSPSLQEALARFMQRVWSHSDKASKSDTSSYRGIL